MNEFTEYLVLGILFTAAATVSWMNNWTVVAVPCAAIAFLATFMADRVRRREE